MEEEADSDEVLHESTESLTADRVEVDVSQDIPLRPGLLPLYISLIPYLHPLLCSAVVRNPSFVNLIVTTVTITVIVAPLPFSFCNSSASEPKRYYTNTTLSLPCLSSFPNFSHRARLHALNQRMAYNL